MTKNFRKAGRAIFGGALALQATSLIKASNRTIGKMVATTEGFIGIGVTGFAADAAFGMVEGPGRAFATKTKLKRRKRK